jgi:2TM domain
MDKNATPAEKKHGFRVHAIVFVLTIAVLLVINLLTGSPYWILWVLLGWGIGLFSHWFFVLGPGAGKAETPNVSFCFYHAFGAMGRRRLGKGACARMSAAITRL